MILVDGTIYVGYWEDNALEIGIPSLTPPALLTSSESTRQKGVLPNIR
jgi:hypothetical protein